MQRKLQRMEKKHHFIGLTDAEVQESRSKYGENVLTPPAKEPLWKKFLGKFHDPLIIILLIAGLLSIGISFYEYFGLDEGLRVFFEPVGIFIAILLATGLAFIFEVKADREFAILNQVNDEEPVEVIRNGKFTKVPKRDVVVGDIIKIETGDEVPADAELLDAVQLSIDESTLTGEPICRKSDNPKDADAEATFPTNHAMRGTKVMEGHATCRVFAVGDMTENGKVYTAAQIDNSVKTPLNEQLDRLGALITKASYLIAALIIVGRIVMYLHLMPFGWVSFIAYVLNTIMIAVTLIVVAVPEGLPMAVTLSLAYSMRRMLKTNNLVRKMHACETMGATTVICTDKTGTLTQNQMTVSESRFGVGDDLLIAQAISVNSTAQLDETNPDRTTVLGNPTEGALLLWIKDKGYDYEALREENTIEQQLPFSTERKYMATIVLQQMDDGEKRVLFAKGASEILFDHCVGVDRDDVMAHLLEFQSKAMRTLGFAYKVLADGEQPIANGRIVASGMTFMGIVAISDPVRSDVPAAVRECLNAGIDVKIVTGDTPGTAREIGRQIGLIPDEMTDEQLKRYVITGPEFDALTDEALESRVEGMRVIARAKPMDKKRLVEALQKCNHVVAVTGDGTNDAPALNAAHVGLSMGDGTSVAKEASDITIIDNSFSSITKAVMWGRSLYQNIQRFILFQLTVNVVACCIVLAGAFLGTQSPLTVTQMLWVNLIMDTFAAMALASLPPTEKVMKDKPRDRRAFIINKAMKWNIISVGVIMTIILLVVLYVLQRTDISRAMDLLTTWPSFKPDKYTMSDKELSMFFTIFVMMQFWNMFNARAFLTGRSAFHFKDCNGFVMIMLLILFGQIFIVSFGGEMFNVVPLPLSDWLFIIVVTSPVLWIGEVIRMFKDKKTPCIH